MTSTSPSNPPPSPGHNVAEATADTAPVEVDTPAVNDTDSTLSTEISSYTASLTSSVLNYPTEFGRQYLSTSILDWPKLVKNVFEHLNPGGWAEFQDFDLLYYSEDGSITDEHHLLKWIKLFIDTARTKLNREPCPGPRLEGWIRDAGFTNVVHRKFRLPLGPWPKDPQLKDIGMCNIAQLLQGLEPFSLKIFCGVLGMSMDEVLVMLAQVRQELYARKFHALFDL